MITETITWITDGSLPDADTTVLIEAEVSGGTDVFTGYFDGHVRIDCTGWPCRQTVIAWADLPAGSRATR